jgi:hypothetical protein
VIRYRRIQLADVDVVTAFALKALDLSKDLPVHVSAAKVRSMVTTFALYDQHFHLVAFDEGAPVAALAVYVAEMPFHERCEGHVMICYAQEPGTGVHLINSMMRWIKGDARIQRVQWAMNECTSPMVARMSNLIRRRWKFDRSNDNLIFYKGG